MISIYNVEIVKSYFKHETGSFHNHLHCKTMKELWCTAAVLGIRERPNLAHNLVSNTLGHWQACLVAPYLVPKGPFWTPLRT